MKSLQTMILFSVLLLSASAYANSAPDCTAMNRKVELLLVRIHDDKPMVESANLKALAELANSLPIISPEYELKMDVDAHALQSWGDLERWLKSSKTCDASLQKILSAVINSYPSLKPAKIKTQALELLKTRLSRPHSSSLLGYRLNAMALKSACEITELNINCEKATQLKEDLRQITKREDMLNTLELSKTWSRKLIYWWDFLRFKIGLRDKPEPYDTRYLDFKKFKGFVLKEREILQKFRSQQKAVGPN